MFLAQNRLYILNRKDFPRGNSLVKTIWKMWPLRKEQEDNFESYIVHWNAQDSQTAIFLFSPL